MAASCQRGRLQERWTYPILCLVAVLLPLANSLAPGEAVVGGGGQGTGPRQLRGPMGLAETPSGDLLVADTDNSRIQLCPAWRQDISINPSGPCSTVAGSPDGIPGWEANRLRTPYIVVLGKVNGSSYSFYVVDSLNHRVQLFRSGSLDGVTVVGGPGVGSPTYNGTGELEFPTGGTFDEARGWLYVADTGHHRIVRYGVDSTGAIVGLGVTVAGSPNQAGSTLRLLDNPSSISFENYAQRLYIADTRNSRVMSWDVSFEGVAAQAAALAFAGGRRLDPEERELSEENVITTSTMTTTKGESVVVEMSGLKGRPYGVMRNQGATYIADSDGCAIVKVLDGQSVTVVGGLCGSSLSQLSFPGGLLVSYDGAIIIADSGNSRVLRVGPEPGKVSLQCPLGGPCSVTLRGGNPYHSHALAVVALSDNSTCGGKCSVSGISGPMWSSGKNPSSPLLNDMVFDFGISSYGKTMTNYLLCWGKQGNINEMEGGNCSSFPYTIGALRLLPYVEGQDGSTNECVKGTNCLITLRGYGIPAGFMVSIPPGSQPPDGISCGLGANNFLGYRDFVDSNPGVVTTIQEPFKDQGNLTAIIPVDFGTASGVGIQRLCVCYEGGGCIGPPYFQEPAGYMRIRSALGGDRFLCQRGQNCLMTVRGAFLKITDKIAVMNGYLSDCKELDLSAVKSLPFGDATPQALFAAVADPFNNNGFNTANFTVGLATGDGIFKVCYCASYDGSDAGSTACDSAAEFTVLAGVLSLLRISPSSFECVLGRSCSLSASGVDMTSTDVIIVTDTVADSACGTTMPVQGSVVLGVAYKENFFAAESGGSVSEQSFNTGIFDSAGQRQACYCSSYDEDPSGARGLRTGACNDPGEFFQPLGVVTVRGPFQKTLRCPSATPCNITVTGAKLSTHDRLQVCPIPVDGSDPCGQAALCAEAGPEARIGLLQPAVATSSQTTFSLGTITSGTFALCYCAAGVGSSAEIPCSSPADLFMSAGFLQVRGVNGGQRFTCLKGRECTLTVEGFKLSSSDWMMIMPLESTCGNSSKLQDAFAFNPSAIAQARVGYAQTSEMKFDFASVQVAGRYRVCYCLLAACEVDGDFTSDAGVVIVKGLDNVGVGGINCEIGLPCSLPLVGSGLVHGSDAVQLIPLGFSCGGLDLRVSGGNTNGTKLFNGTYTKAEGLTDNRPWYTGRDNGQVIFFDIFYERWIMGSTRNPEIPDEAGWAWAKGSLAMTPDKVTPGTWQVHEAPSAAAPLGRWVVHPDLRVAGAIDPNVSFSHNPSYSVSAETIDSALGLPWLQGETFELGITASAAVYRICFCPSWDDSDSSNQTCSSDDEFMMNPGALLVGYLRGQESYHCLLGADCSVSTFMPAGVSGIRAVLIPQGMDCFLATTDVPSPWSSSRNISGRLLADSFSAFDFGTASVFGSFEVCVCTGYDDSSDGVPCSEMHEFYERAGGLTVSNLVLMSYVVGNEASLNLTLGSGLSLADRILFVEGDSCTPLFSADAGLIASAASPMLLGDRGAWTSYGLGNRTGATYLLSGSYAVCLCTGWDGADALEVPCDSGSEFKFKVARVQVGAVSGPSLSASATSSLELRLQLARRLGGSVAVASTTFALSSALETLLAGLLETQLAVSPVNVVVWGVTALEGSGLLNVTVNFTATLSAPASVQMIQVRPSDNASCPMFLLDPPWNNLDQAATAEETLILDCLRLTQVMGSDANAGLVFATSLRSALASLSVPGLAAGIEVVSLSLPVVKDLGWKPASFKCVRGAPCSLVVSVPAGGGLLPAKGSLQVIAGDLTCGSTSAQVTNLPASSRAAPGFSAGNPVVANLLVASADRTIDVGVTGFIGTYNLCYCAGTSGVTCQLDGDFISSAGTLTVRGLPSSSAAFCVAHLPCTITLQGLELTQWDRLLVKNGQGGCSDLLSSSTLIGSEFFAINPASLSSEAGLGRRTFDLGLASNVGMFSMCYCASYSAPGGNGSASLPCQSPADFTIEGGLLYVRGVQSDKFRYGCVKSISGDGESPCTLYVAGEGIMPDQDKILVTPSSGPECGEVAAATTTGISPNPIVLGLPLGDPVVQWGAASASVAARWTVRRAELAGSFRVCYCSDSADGSMQGLGNCKSGAAGFYFQVGSVTIRGASGGQIFMCSPGKACQVTVYGVGLSVNDKVRIVGPGDACYWPYPKLQLAANSPAGAVYVDANGTTASFDLGMIFASSPAGPVSARLCCCANFDADWEGGACANSSDYTHSAGIINTVVCPDPPSSQFYFPPVEDVIGDPGDPRAQLYVIPGRACLDLTSRTSVYLQSFSSQIPLGEGHGFANKGGAEIEGDQVLSTGYGRCLPAVDASTPRLNSANTTFVDLSVVGGMEVSKANWLRFSVDARGAPLAMGFKVRGRSRVVDAATPPSEHFCIPWEVEFVPVACGWDATLVFGGILHGFLLLTLVAQICSLRLWDLLARVGYLKKVDPIIRTLAEKNKVAQAPQLGSQQAAPGATGTSIVQVVSVQPPGADQVPASLAVEQDDTGGIDGWDDVPHLVLTSRPLAVALGLYRGLSFFFHMLLLSDPGGVGEITLLFVIPFLFTLGSLAIQAAMLFVAFGPEKLWTVARRPQYVIHSFTSVFKLHLDLVLPTVARRNHCELWRPATILVTCEIITHVAMPVIQLFMDLLPKRRLVPRQVTLIPWFLLGIGPPEDLEPLQATECSRIQETEDNMVNLQDYRTQQAAKKSPYGPNGRRSTLVGFQKGQTMVVTRNGTMSQHQEPQSQSVAGAGHLRMSHLGQPGASRNGGTPHADVGVDRKSKAAGRVSKFAQQLKQPGLMMINEAAAVSKQSVRKSLVMLHEKEQGEETKHQLKMMEIRRLLELDWRAHALTHTGRHLRAYTVTPLVESLKYLLTLQWDFLALFSLMEREPPEECRRRTIIGLWSFLENSGWYAASVEFRRQAEIAAGVNVPRQEARWSLLCFLVGGLDVAVLSIFLAAVYAPRLTSVESTALIMAAVASIFQAGRPGMAYAAIAVAEDLFDRPQALAWWAFLGLAYRIIWTFATNPGCARNEWFGYTLWSASVMFIEFPFLLFCWRAWPVVQAALEGGDGPWPSWREMLADLFEAVLPSWLQAKQEKTTPWVKVKREAIPGTASAPPNVPSSSRMEGALKSKAAPTADLRAAAMAVELLRAQEGEVAASVEKKFPEAEPILEALLALVEELNYCLPEDICAKLLDQPGNEVDKIMWLIRGYYRLPPLKYGLQRRRKKLLRICQSVEGLASILQYTDEGCRSSYDILRSRVTNEMFIAKLAVRTHAILSSAHFQHGSLRSRAQLLARGLPTAPGIWLVHWKTLSDLGRLPHASEFQHLTHAMKAHEAHGPKAVVLVAVHRWRSRDEPDPHGVTWRQLVTFARWYKWRWSETEEQELEPYFWLDWCCMPELCGPPVTHEELLKKKQSLKVEKAESMKRLTSVTSVEDEPGLEVTATPKSLPGLKFINRLTRLQAWAADGDDPNQQELGQLSPKKKKPSKMQAEFTQTMSERGLNNLQALVEEVDAQKDVEADLPLESHIDVDDEPDGIDICAGRAMPATNEGADALLPLMFAAADAVVCCHSHGAEDDAWYRLYMAMAYSLSPFGRLVYEVDRRVVHVTRFQKRAVNRGKSMTSAASSVYDPFMDGSRPVSQLEDGPQQGQLGNTMTSAQSWPIVREDEPTVMMPLDDYLFMDESRQVTGASVAVVRGSVPNYLGVPFGSGAFDTSGITEVTAMPSLGGTMPRERDLFGNTVGSAVSSMHSGFESMIDSAMGTTLGSNLAERDTALKTFLDRSETVSRERILHDPTDWANTYVELPESRARVLRLAAFCLDTPTVGVDGNFRRPALAFGKSKALVCRLQPKPRNTRSRDRLQMEVGDESSSDSSEEDGPQRPRDELAPLPPPLAAFTFNKQTATWSDKMLEMYFDSNEGKLAPIEASSVDHNALPKTTKVGGWAAVGAAIAREDKLRSAAVIDSDGQQRAPLASEALLQRTLNLKGCSLDSEFAASGATRSLQPKPFKAKVFGAAKIAPPETLFFHERFKSKSIVLKDMNKSAGQNREERPAAMGPSNATSSGGGMAITSLPLIPRDGVAPDAPLAFGIAFDITIEETDLQWRDGLGIGFTCQDPDLWHQRKPPPKNAIPLLRTCTVGYGGRWFCQGKSEILRGAWEPGKLSKGDLVTAVLVGAPANVMRVLVNGKVVTQRALKDCGLPDPTSEQLWGIVDVESACVKVRLGLPTVQLRMLASNSRAAGAMGAFSAAKF